MKLIDVSIISRKEVNIHYTRNGQLSGPSGEQTKMNMNVLMKKWKQWESRMHSTPSPPAPAPREIALIGGDGYSTGNIFVKNINGHYGPICDDGWDDTDAVVACRSIRYRHFQKCLFFKMFNSGNGDTVLELQQPILPMEVSPLTLQWMM